MGSLGAVAAGGTEGHQHQRGARVDAVDGDLDAELTTAAHRALSLITRQNFGAEGAPWLDWWARAQHRHRVEWLIDALLHAEATIRHEASEELKVISGQYFGYYFNLPRRERERAHARYVAWWQSDASKGLRERARA